MTEHITFSAAIRQQPESLERALGRIRSSVLAANPAPWLPGQTVAIIAMGASGHSANALVAALTSAGVRSANITASDLFDAAPGFEPGDHCLVVSESGRSPEPIRAAERLRGARGGRIGITNFPDAAISAVVDSTIDLGGFADSPVYTVGYTATLVAYSELLRATGYPELAIEKNAVPALVSQALAVYERLAPALAAHFVNVTSIDCVGRGYSFASAAESALIIRESLRIPTAAYDSYEYLHGPMESGKRGTGLIVFGDDRELSMIASPLDSGVRVVLVTAAPPDRMTVPEHENLIVVPLPAAAVRLARAMIEIIAIQLLTEAMASARSITIEDFLFEQDDTKLKEVTIG